MNKDELRHVYKNKRNKLSSDAIQNYSLEISNKLLQINIWNFLYYHIFLTITQSKEIDTSYLLTLLQGKDKNIIIPKVAPDTELDNYLLTDNTVFRKNKWRIPEPENGILIDESQIEVVFLPLLAYDLSGNRVGYGKGFYDKFLKKCNPNVVKIGLSFFEAEEKIDDISGSDIPLNYCITPNKVYQF